MWVTPEENHADDDVDAAVNFINRYLTALPICIDSCLLVCSTRFSCSYESTDLASICACVSYFLIVADV